MTRYGLALALAACGLFCCAGTAPAGYILSDERVTQERPLQPLAPHAPEKAPPGTAREARAPLLAGDTPAAENLLETIDVYALSPHARALALPRMAPLNRTRPLIAYPDAAQWAALDARLSDAPHHPGPLQGIPALWEEIIRRSAAAYGLPPALVAAVIRVESAFDPGIVSGKGAQGLMQLMPSTGREMGVDNPFDPEENVRGGCAYLRRQLDRFGSLELALAAYNAGPGAVVKHNGLPPYAETQTYIHKVLQLYAP